MSRLGHEERTWFQRMTLPCASGAHSVLSSATVIVVAHVFFGFTTMARPSYAIGTSMYSMLALEHASISAGRIGRDALLMSDSPRQNFWNPPPVPEMPTVGVRTSGLALPYSSATASAMGNTVLEPSSVMSSSGAASPSCRVDESLPPPHATVKVTRTATAAGNSECLMPSRY